MIINKIWIITKIYLPPFKNSAVDGYAILKKDLNLSDGDVVDMLQLVMDRFKNRSSSNIIKT
mgnify:CR=1 FL=1